MKSSRRALVVLLACALVGLGLSLVLWLRHSGHELAWLGALCSSAEDSGCNEVARSPLAAPFGVPLAFMGVLFYASLAALGATAWRGGESYLRTCRGLAAAGLVVDVGLLSYSLFGLGTLCGLCAATYLATLGAFLAALRAEAPREASAPPALAFGVALAVALVSASALVVERARAVRPETFADDPDQALRLAWEAFHAHYQRTSVQPIETRSSARRGAQRPVLEFVLFADFACAHCQRAAKLLAEVVERHRDTTALVFKHYPLDGGCNPHSEAIHPGACTLAFAAESARRQGRFWPLHDRLFAERELWARGVSPAQLGALASEAGLDTGTFATDLDSEGVRAAVSADLAQAETLGVTGTPTLFINGRRMPSIPIVTFLEELLAAESEAQAGFVSASRGARGAGE